MLIFLYWVGLPEWAILQWFHPFDSVRRLVFTTFTNKSGMFQQCLAINMRLPGLHQLFTGKNFQNAFQMFFQQEKQEMVLVLSLMRHVFVYWVRMVYDIYIYILLYIHVSTVLAHGSLSENDTVTPFRWWALSMKWKASGFWSALWSPCNLNTYRARFYHVSSWKFYENSRDLTLNWVCF